MRAPATRASPTQPIADPNDPFQSGLSQRVNGDVAALGHSTALSGRVAPPINPRAILLGDRIILTYPRGVQRVELTTRDQQTYVPHFYLLTFEQAVQRKRTRMHAGRVVHARGRA